MSLSSDKIEIELNDLMTRINLDELVEDSGRWALSNGFVQRCFDEKNRQNDFVKHFPFTIFPSTFPRVEFERARRFQSTINLIVKKLSSNFDLLESILKPISQCDEFVRKLWEIFIEIEKFPHRSVAESCVIRADFMLDENAPKQTETKLRLIEMNTIAVGLGAAAKLIHSWHKRFLTKFAPKFLSSFPENESHNLIVETLFQSWKIYENPKSLIVFVVPENEFNISDQTLIEQALIDREPTNLTVKFATFDELAENCSIDQRGILFLSKKEVGLVYYRHGYDPKHFHSEKIWKIFKLIESSRSVKCPSLRFHLAGMKCFQMSLTDRNFLEKIFPSREVSLDEIQKITGEIFSLDEIEIDPNLRRRIDERPDSFYLKQSREGGGSVYCGVDLRKKIDQIREKSLSKRYFLMSRVYGKSYRTCIRSPDKSQPLSFEQINSELGIFSGLIVKDKKIIFEQVGTSLLRSKPIANIEGGIASGQGCIDSVILD